MRHLSTRRGTARQAHRGGGRFLVRTAVANEQYLRNLLGDRAHHGILYETGTHQGRNCADILIEMGRAAEHPEKHSEFPWALVPVRPRA